MGSESTQFKPGQRQKGNRKGVKNKVTVDIREVFNWAFRDIGGREALSKWARNNKKTFYQTFAKLAPKELDINLSQQENFIESLAMKELTEVDATIVTPSLPIAEEGPVNTIESKATPTDSINTYGTKS